MNINHFFIPFYMFYLKACGMNETIVYDLWDFCISKEEQIFSIKGS